MHTSSLVATLDADHEDALAAIATDPRFSVGELHRGRWLGLVLETSDEAESKRAYRWLCSLPGVDHADVVLVHFDSSPHTNGAENCAGSKA
jgi:hypothetical protein